VNVQQFRILQCTYDCPVGKNDVNAITSSAIYRPFHRLFAHGAPPGRINYLYLVANGQEYPPDTDDVRAPPQGADLSRYGNADVRLFGALCFMDSQRLAFFPSYRGNRLTLYTADGTAKQQHSLIPDHFSLDRDGKKWHLTYVGANGARQHMRHPCGTELDEGVVHWFDMAVQSPSHLEPAYRKNVLEVTVPASDAERRFKLMEAAIGNATHHIMHPQIEAVTDPPNYWLLNVLVDLNGRDLSRIPRKAVKGPPPALVDPPLPSKDIPCRLHWVQADGFAGTVWMMVSQLRGTLKEHVVISHGA
jgi:hypothetical protein